MDPFGYYVQKPGDYPQDFMGPTPVEREPIATPVPTGSLDRDMSFDDYWSKWRGANPGLSGSFGEYERILKEGCVGVSMCNLGVKQMPFTIGHYKEKVCFNAKGGERANALKKAKALQAKWIKECKCSKLGHNEPVLFGFTFWSNPGQENGLDTAYQPDGDGIVDMTGYYEDATFDQKRYHGRKIQGSNREYVNFDFGWYNPDGSWVHANHVHRPPNKLMKVYSDEWKTPDTYRGFDRTVVCVMCTRDEFK